MEETFLPNNYEVPQSPSNYTRFQEGINRIRILSSAIVGFEYFKKDNKPTRQREPFDYIPDDIKEGGKIKPFWAFVIWNYQVKKIQICEITQKTIMTQIKSLVDNKKWGVPKKYDIAITKTGEGMETEYSVQGEPPISEIPNDIVALYDDTKINLEALYDGEDPFK